ncbi:MAG: BolA family transcriptional regulator [Phormidesmis sp. RL_2_1]|nr:BolA family transcriptional regulator [Phormidesmis sp. RL_2_1]
MISPDQLELMIKASLPDAQITTEDMKGTGDHYQIAVVSSAFEGLSLVKRHQLVYQAVNSAMSSDAIHALSLETNTPEEVSAR